MKTILIFLISISCFAQNENPGYTAFKKKLEAQIVKADNAKPAPCASYKLVYVVKSENFKETVFEMNSYSLCDDLNKFDVSKNPAPTGWSYDIKAISDKYYIIRADHKTDSPSQDFYYYERKK